METVIAAELLAVVIFMQVRGIRVDWLAGGYGGGRGVVMYGVCVALFLPTLIGRGPIKWLLESGPFRFAGQRSYSLYLIQILAGQALVGMDPYITDGMRKAMLVAIVGLVFSDFLYRFVEVPMIAFGKRLTVKLRERTAARKSLAALHRGV